MNVFKIKNQKNIGLLIFIILLIEGISFLFRLLSMSNQNLYAKLIKPNFSPPGWVFSIVWPILYFLIAISLYRIILNKKQGKNVTKGITYFFIQLFLNFIKLIR